MIKPKLILALIVLLLAIAYHNRADAEDRPPGEALPFAKQAGWLPAWADMTDRWRIVPQWPVAATLCLENRQGPERWLVSGSFEYLIVWVSTGLVRFNPGEARKPATAAQLAVCWPAPVASVPVAIGDPVYRAIAHTKAASWPYWRNDTPLDWVWMNANAVMRPTAAREPCRTKLSEPTGDADPRVAWYTLAAGGMTRCRL